MMTAHVGDAPSAVTLRTVHDIAEQPRSADIAVFLSGRFVDLHDPAGVILKLCLIDDDRPRADAHLQQVFIGQSRTGCMAERHQPSVAILRAVRMERG